MTKFNVFKIESLSTLDGPGIRVVIFLQGCMLRCKFCHNPESWHTNSTNLYTVDELYELIMRYYSYFKNNGGVTFSGGEPLLQTSNLVKLCKKLKNKKIHVALDTSGYYQEEVDELLSLVDLIIYDVKALEDDMYKQITGNNINISLSFLNKCIEMKKEIWIRQVIIPTINDNFDYIEKLKKFIKSIPNVTNVELLPYHDMAKTKYKELNLKYVYQDIDNMDLNLLDKLQEYLKK